MKAAGPKFEIGLDVTMRVLYVAVMLCLLWAFLPGLRELGRRWLLNAIYLYRLERWGAQYARRPGWEREALRVRGRAPKKVPDARSSGPVPQAYLELEEGPGGGSK